MSEKPRNDAMQKLYEGLNIDTRPKKGGWAAGNYFGTCCECNETFIGDKRAVVCSDCAYGTKS